MPLNKYGIFYVDPSSEMSLHNISGAQATSISSLISKISTIDDVLYYTTTQYFNKANYPNAKALKIRAIGGGGGGGGCSVTAASQVSVGFGGAGGYYAESLIANLDDLPQIIPISIGAGGAGGAAGNNAGGTGGTTSFGTFVQALGGTGGAGMATSGVPDYNTPTFNNTSSRGLGLGDIVIPGGPGFEQINVSFTQNFISAGGASYYSPRTRVIGNGSTYNAAASDVPQSYEYGLGGTGSANCQSQATGRAGSAGRPGILIVEVYS